jgi:DNA-damage-inducible protein D
MNQQQTEIVPRGDLRLILFKGREIRQVFHNNEWFFSVIDVIKVLSDSSRPSQYWAGLKTQLADQ